MHKARMPGRPRQQKYIEQLMLDPKPFIKKAKISGFSPRRCLEFLRYCDKMIVAKPKQGLSIASKAIRIAHWTDDCSRCRSFAILLSALRTMEDYRRAEIAFQVANGFSEACPECKGDLYCRRAVLQLRQHSSEMFDDLEQAFQYFNGDGDGIGRVLHLRSLGEFYLKDAPDLAIQSVRLSIQSFSPHEHRYRNSALNSLVIFLSKTGKDGSLEAAKLFPKVRRAYRGVKLPPSERAKLTWTEAIVMHAGGRIFKALDLLIKARDIFVKLEMPHEVAAISADISMFMLNDSYRIQRDMNAVLSWSFITGGLRDACIRIQNVAKRPRSSRDLLFQAIKNLRKMATLEGMPGMAMYSLSPP